MNPPLTSSRPEPGPEASRATPRTVLHRAAGLSSASLVAALLTVPTTFLAARWLGAADFGRAQFVVLVYSYAALVRLGAFEGGVRSFIHHRHLGDKDRATKDQNVGVSVELVAALVPGLVLAAIALFSHDSVRTLGLALSPVAAVAASAAAYLAGLHIAREHFGLVARMNVLRAIALPVFVLGGVALVGAPAVFIGPVLADGLCVLAYLFLAPPLDLHWDFHGPTARRLVRTGFPLGLLAVVYWVYRLVGVTTVAATSSAALLGLYTFAAAPVTVVARAVSGMQTVIMPGLWGEMAGRSRRWIEDGNRLTILMAVVSGVATSLAQAGFAPMVHLVANRFAGSISFFNVLAMNILLLSIATVPSLVLTSQLFNRQTRYLAIWIGGLALNVAANVVVRLTGQSLLAIAWNDVWVQLLVVVAIFEAAAPLQRPEWQRRSIYPPLLGMLALTGALGLGLHTWGAGDGTAAQLLGRLALRLAVVGVVWGIAAFALLRWQEACERVQPAQVAQGGG